MNTVCLCGSTRFAKEFEEANVELTKRGYSVITISMCLPKDEEDAGLKALLDLVHLNKILRSDAVVLVGDGYVGQSTAREILWANMHGKSIIARCDYEGWDDLEAELQSPSGGRASVVENARARLSMS